MLRAYLAELERELSGHLPNEDVAARLAEAEAHLRDGVEGRIELGMEPEAAAWEAIQAFGAPRELARRAARAARAGRERLRNRAQEATLTLAILSIVVGPVAGRAYLAAQGLAAAGLLLFAAASYRVGRPAPGATLARSLAGVAALAALVGVFWLRPEAFSGAGYGARWDFRGERENYVARLPRLRRDAAIFEGARAALATPGGAEALRDPQGYLAPVVLPPGRLWQTLETTRVPTVDAARAAWRDFETRGRDAVNVAQTEAFVRGLDRAQSRPLANFFACALPMVPIVGVYGLGFVGIDLVCGLLGGAAARIRRRWRGGVA